MWWFAKQSPKKEESSLVTLRYEDIPDKTDKRLEGTTYPQVLSTVPASSLQEICNRYADRLHALLDDLPQTKEQIDELVMPVLQRVIELVHLIPASEAHHHSGIGGCLVHQLECAAAAVKLAKSHSVRTGDTLEENYHNKNRFLLTAALVALTHDLGKVFDLRVVDAVDHEWEAEKESLMQWLSRLGIKEYFVTWVPERQHKKHQIRSLRLAYGRIFTQQLICYLDAYPHDKLLRMFDEAVAFGEGPLGDILRQAEEFSILQDAEIRRHLLGQYVHASSPLIPPMLAAMKDNIAQGYWKVNTKDSLVFVTTKGVFLLLNEEVVFSVRQRAAEKGIGYLPGTIPGFVLVLAEGGCLVAKPDSQQEQDRYAWQICLKFDEPRRFDCLRLDDGVLLFGNKAPPKALELCEAAQEKPQEKAATTMDFRAPAGGFTKADKEAQALTNAAGEVKKQKENRQQQKVGLSESELEEVWPQKPDAVVCQQFVERLCETIQRQMLAGKGRLFASVQKISDDQIRADSHEVEAVLKRHRIETTTFEMLLQMRTSLPGFTFEQNGHWIICRLKKPA